MNTSNTIKAASDLADSAVAITDKARVATKQAADTVADEIESGVDSLRKTVPEALSRATAQAEDLARLGIERARRASGAVRQQAVRMGDQTVGYIKDEPVKSMLIAAAAGAAAALVVGWLSRSRSDRE